MKLTTIKVAKLQKLYVKFLLNIRCQISDTRIIVTSPNSSLPNPEFEIDHHITAYRFHLSSITLHECRTR